MPIQIGNQRVIAVSDLKSNSISRYKQRQKPEKPREKPVQCWQWRKITGIPQSSVKSPQSSMTKNNQYVTDQTNLNNTIDISRPHEDKRK